MLYVFHCFIRGVIFFSSLMTFHISPITCVLANYTLMLQVHIKYIHFDVFFLFKV